MKWDGRTEEYKQWQREQKAKYGWGGTDSIWDGRLVALVILIAVIFLAIDATVFKVLLGWFK